jgi:hypothetical protein
MVHEAGEQGREPSEEDLRAVEEVLARLMPSPGRDTPEYEQKLKALAAYRAEAGADWFDLRCGLRAPRDPVEQAEADLFRGRITQEQLLGVMKADAERPRGSGP